MKATKKIVGAVAALVAAAALSFGSSFAWFAGNGAASATGISVGVAVPTNLFIAEGIVTSPSRITGASLTFNDSSATLNPSTLSNNGGSYEVSIPDEDSWITPPSFDGAGEAGRYTDVGSIALNEDESANGHDLSDYVLTQRMTLMRKESIYATYMLSATVTITGFAEGDNCWKFLRFAFFDGNFFISSGNLTSPSDDGSFVLPFTLYTDARDYSPIQLVFIVWFEGTDPDCINANALNMSELNFSILFSATPY